MNTFRPQGSVVLRNACAVLALSVAATLAGAGSLRAASDVYLSAPKNDAAHPYVYHNTFPDGVGDFVSSKEVGGDVFAPGPQSGDKFPLDIKIQDENNQPAYDRLLRRKRTPGPGACAGVGARGHAASRRIPDLRQIQQN